MLTLFILSYTLGAIVTYGALFAWWQQDWWCKETAKRYYKLDIMRALLAGVLWPLANIITLIVWDREPFQSGLKFY